MSQHKKLDEDFRPGFLRDRGDLPSEEELEVLREHFIAFTRSLFPHLYGQHVVHRTDNERQRLREDFVFFVGRLPEEFTHSTQGFYYFAHINEFLGNPAPFSFDDMLRVLVCDDKIKT